MSVNKVILLGRLTKKPELKYTQKQTPVCNFSIATNKTITDKSGNKTDKTEFHKIVVWGKLAETCDRFLDKGRQAYFEGELQTRSYDDKQGNKKYTTEINAHTVQFIGPNESKKSEGMDFNEAASTFNQGLTLNTDSSFTTDDIPF